MTAISIVSILPVSEARAHDHSPKAVVLFLLFWVGRIVGPDDFWRGPERRLALVDRLIVADGLTTPFQPAAGCPSVAVKVTPIRFFWIQIILHS